MKIFLPILFIVSLSVFSLIAFTIGLNLASEKPQDSILYYNQLSDSANKGISVDSLKAREKIPPKLLFNIYYKLSESAKYAYGEGSYLSAYKLHSQRKGLEKFSLYFHIILGSVVLFTGGFQFWTWFRRKYKKAHRALGTVYVVSIIGMGMAIFSYLINAGIYTTHEGFVGYWGLHLLNSTTVIPVFFSLFYLYKKDFGKHMGWMALSFGSILTAPTQRLSWSIIASLKPEKTHAVINSVVDTYLFAFCFLLGYLLFCINRFYSPRIYNAKENEYSFFTKILVCCIGFLAIATILYHYVFTNGLIDSDSAKTIMSDYAIHAEQSVLSANRTLGIVFSLTTCLGLFLTPYIIFAKKTTGLWLSILLISVSIVAFIELYWGRQIGLPQIKYSVGGSHYFFWGLCHLFFVLLVILGQTKYQNFSKEWRFGLWMVLLITPLRYWYIYYHASIADSIDPIFFTQNHVHQFISGLAPATIFILMIIFSTYNSNTKNRMHY